MASEKPKIRPLTPGDIEEFYPEGVKLSVRGVAVEVDGKVIAVAGMSLRVPYLAFSTMKDEMRKYPKMILKTARQLQDIMRQYKSDVFAEADVNEKNSFAFLHHLGFEHVDERLFVWRI